MEVAKQQRPSWGSLSSLPSDDAEPDRAYHAVLDWIWSFSARPRSPEDVSRQRAVKLERMYALLARLGHPEQSFPSVLVAGTKGKGSTVAMLSACLQAAGYRAGRYTSPHLWNWRERACIDGDPISTDAVRSLSHPIRQAIDQLPTSLGTPTTFEVGTAFALLHFARQRVDVAVLEIGTGGRFDATNLAESVVSVIAPVSYDHTHTLGSSLTSIAWHKAGIIRPWRPVVTAAQPEEALVVIEAEAHQLAAPLQEVGRDWRWSASGAGISISSDGAKVLETEIGLLGDHQRDNATTTVATLNALSPRFRISTKAMQTGLKMVEWPGRLQVLSERPLVVVDGAHNAASAEVVRHALDNVFGFERLFLIVGLSEGKDALGVLHSLAPQASSVFLTRSRHERSLPPAELEPLARAEAPSAQIAALADVPSALESALRIARPDDMILVTGSLFLVGEALLWWRRSRP